MGGEREKGTDAEADRRLLMGLLAVHDAPCPRCGYGLKGLVEARCPECGGELALQEVMRGRPLVPRELRGVQRWTRVVLSVAALWGTLVLVVAWGRAAGGGAGGVGAREGLALAAALGAWLGVAVACGTRMWAMAETRMTAETAGRVMMWCAGGAVCAVGAATAVVGVLR